MQLWHRIQISFQPHTVKRWSTSLLRPHINLACWRYIYLVWVIVFSFCCVHTECKVHWHPPLNDCDCVQLEVLLFFGKLTVHKTTRIITDEWFGMTDKLSVVTADAELLLTEFINKYLSSCLGRNICMFTVVKINTQNATTISISWSGDW